VSASALQSSYSFERTTIVLNNLLFVVAFFPFSSPVPARIQDPLHTVRMYLAPGACLLRNPMSDGSTASGAACTPVRNNPETMVSKPK
jgi:hypothetical protein